MRSTLILGGARSGKSSYAQKLAMALDPPVLFVATAGAGDREMLRRIEEHRKARPPDWKTLEAATGVASQVLREAGDARTVVVDCITLLVSNIFGEYGTSGEIDAAGLEKAVVGEVEGFIACISEVPANFIFVSNEVGLGLVPADPVSRLYRDLLGRANQLLAQAVDEVYFMVAGIPTAVKSAPAD